MQAELHFPSFLVDIAIDAINDKADSRDQHASGSQEGRSLCNDRPFRTRSFSNGVFTMESSVSMMRIFLEFVKKRHCSAGFFIIQEIVVAVMRKFLGTEFLNEWGFHGSTTKGKKKMKKKKHRWM